jgi:hypothetical protein
MMRLVALILFAGAICGRASPPEINRPSPDQTWRITAQWVRAGTSQEGYDWSLENLKTGKIFFHDPIASDAVLPTRFEVLWTPDSHYAALNIYYGRRLFDVSVIRIADTPELLGLPLTFPGVSPEKAFLDKQDLPLFQGYQPPLRGASAWDNNTDLRVGLGFYAYLLDRKTGKKFNLASEWQQTIRFGTSGKVIRSECESYDKFATPN